jgi:predicted nucleic acid-binding protein
MMIVDSNAWADHFNGVEAPHVERLDAGLVDEEDLTALPIIVTEVLQDFRAERGFREAAKVLTALPLIHPTLGCHVRTARLFRTLRSRGVTVRGAVDCVIAQTCIDVEAELLSPDRDFQSTSLRLWKD